MTQAFNASEKHQSQIPALQLLVGLGFTPLSAARLSELRGGRTRQVLLEDVLSEQLLKINSFSYRGKDYAFDPGDAEEAIRRLKPTPDKIKGLKATNQDIYDALILGTTITKTIDGDSKSYSFRYIDWNTPANNVFHVAAEVSVERTGSMKTKRCDIIGYVNGIPFFVIENKRPTESLKKADSQLIGYQSEENIPHLFHFAQLLLVMKRNEARYATIGTPRKFWQVWHDTEDSDEDISIIANKNLTGTEKDALFSGEFSSARPFFESLELEGDRAVSEQDRLLHALCRPERLLDMIRRFTVFDSGVRKIARYQQYFGIRETMATIAQKTTDGSRKGGVIWHTQGSGKSLTMVMLARALALDPSIKNPRIIIVTDRDDLDKQIKGTFKSCDLDPKRASSGSNLLSLIVGKTPLITTIINKFETALETARKQGIGSDNDPNLFVLIDESHRTQTGSKGGFGQFALKMRRLLPQAWYLGFTGTPLLKRDRNTLHTLGGLIHYYKIDQAVADEAVVPLLYEGRLVDQQVSGNVIDVWFEKISQGLTDAQKADLKRKFSRMGALSKTKQAISAKAFDISEHYRQHWQGTGFKGQLVAPSKAAAILFKEILDEIGHVTSEVIISPPNENEDNETPNEESKKLERIFWKKMMDLHGGEEAYNRDTIAAFKGSGYPEILIVVSKLLTGFDAPRNTVLYICKTLTEHNLLQAIARVNRLYEDEEREKKFGYIIDYEGLLGELDQALSTYSALEGYEIDDLKDTVRDVRDEIRKLGQLHEQLWDLFKPVTNKMDMEAMEQFLADEAIRQDFYQRFRFFGHSLHISMSSDKALDIYNDAQLSGMKADWKRFSELRRSVQVRYQEVVDLKEYEPKIQKLLDDHVTAMPAETIINIVNINDPEALKAVVDESGISEASKADRIASATRRVLSERMDQDPTFYQNFSMLLENTIRDYRQKRLSEREYLGRVIELAEKIAKKERVTSVPKVLEGNQDGQAFFGLLENQLKNKDGEIIDGQPLAEIALAIIGIIQGHHIVDVWSNEMAQNAMRNAIDDYVFDVLRDENGIQIPMETLDELEQKLMSLAKARFPG